MIQLYNYHAWCVFTNKKHRSVTTSFRIDGDRDFVVEGLSANTGLVRVLWELFLGDGRSASAHPFEIPLSVDAEYPRAYPVIPPIVYLGGQTLVINGHLAPEVNIGRRRVGVSLVVSGFKVQAE